MAFPYRIFVEWSDDDQLYIARVPAFPGLAAHGDTAQDAAHEAQVAAEGMLEVLAEDGEAPPPSDTSELSGRFHLRLPKSLHQRLETEAQAEGVSLNQWMVTKLAAPFATQPARRSRKRRDTAEG
jgi:antitoxin HicB